MKNAWEKDDWVPIKHNDGQASPEQVESFWEMIAEQQAKQRPGTSLILSWCAERGHCEDHHNIVTRIAHKHGLTVPAR